MRFIDQFCCAFFGAISVTIVVDGLLDIFWPDKEPHR